MTVAQDVKAEKTSGNKALISDSRTTEAAGAKVEQTKWEYAVDRKSLEATSSHPSSWNVIPAKGLTVSWPFGAQKKNYQGWTPETQTTAPLTYLRSEKKQGITTYVYEAKVSPTKIVDPQILASLPKELPASLLKLLGSRRRRAPGAGRAAGADPAAAGGAGSRWRTRSRTTRRSGSTRAPAWSSTCTATQQRVAAIALPNGSAVPLIPAVAATYQDTAASSQQAADDARHGRTVIRWLGVYLPIILLALGVVLLALAALLRGRRRAGGGGVAAAGGGRVRVRARGRDRRRSRFGRS